MQNINKHGISIAYLNYEIINIKLAYSFCFKTK